MSEQAKPNDVFISHSPSDDRFALDVAETCRANGLEAVTCSELLQHANRSDALLWDALAESRALLVILSGERLLSELLRMRKKGELTRVRSTVRSRQRKGTA